MNLHEITDRIPRIGFGFEGDTFATTGVNSERLWLHCNSAEAEDHPSGNKPCFYPHIVVTEALETCRSLDEVEAVLDRWERTRGMILFAVDGRMQQAAVFDCTCRTHRRRRSNGGTWIATNHYMDIAAEKLAAHGESVARLHRIKDLLSSSDVRDQALLRVILADDGVERRSRARTTVFSTIACPSTGEMWFACGTGPAASEGTWSHVPWPWDKGSCDRPTAHNKPQGLGDPGVMGE